MCNGTYLLGDRVLRCYCPNCDPLHDIRIMWYHGEAWHRVIPKRKSGDRDSWRDPSQRRIAKYNYDLQRPEEYLESWQSELLNHPRHIRWARRKRQSL